MPKFCVAGLAKRTLAGLRFGWRHSARSVIDAYSPTINATSDPPKRRSRHCEPRVSIDWL